MAISPPLPKEKSVPDTTSVPAEQDTRMITHMVCPTCHPDWIGKVGVPAVCGEKLLGIPSVGGKECGACVKAWSPHADTHYYHQRDWVSRG